MFTAVQAAGRTFYVESPSKTGIYLFGDSEVCLIDSGNDKDAARKILKFLNSRQWKLTVIVNTHSHADHIGGNRFLQEKTGCSILAPRTEAAFIGDPLLEPSFLYGGFPPRQLRNKFLLASESSVGVLTGENLPPGLEAVPLPGHSFRMTGLRTGDGVLFLADCLAGKSLLDKYPVFFVYDVKSYLDTLERVEKMDAPLFVPAHGEATENIAPLARLNRDKVFEIAGLLLKLCAEGRTFEEILEKTFGHYGLTMDFNQYVLAGSTVRSYLSWLQEEGEAEAFFSGNRLLWRRK